ncbi:MAG: hypothetical protein BWY67_02223 [Bacteroidetes bacterium ADurb.Bin397]|nr:MAG: hypothetical protein BWY67_02223 [Bacteroidetes bacterium ADurb.Bin397]
MWVKPENWGSGGTLFDEINGEYWQFNIVDNEWRTRNQFAGEYGTRYNLSIPAISNNQWHHLAFVYSVSQNLKAIYIDGQLADSTNESIFRLTTARTGATLGDGRFSDAFQGIIDEMYFFNRYLNSSEIQTLMNGIIPVLEIENQEDIIEGFNLSQNYPNPFNPSTMINYQLPMNSSITLKVFNMLGQEVTTLVNEQKPAGYYTVEWNGTNSAGQQVGSGVYLSIKNRQRFSRNKENVAD